MKKNGIDADSQSRKKRLHSTQLAYQLHEKK